MNTILMILIGFFLLETLEDLYADYLKCSLEQMFSDNI
ncbi:PF07599 family protein [Leptospira noguchii]|uniref:PF07599 family protein n=2 Tax=Leptospira noguchii TaxID=28182 RepID=T0GWL2_9LEPT|nr:PF07599 family protein [Leptospira noguchii]EQA73347.1 PF07599 family protein [Leptospira noguchii serovar Panama str. CZ214]